MADCIPKADFDHISTFPPQAKTPIIALAVVLSFVVAVAVIVVVVLVRKLYGLKKGLSGGVGDIGKNFKGSIGVASDVHMDMPHVPGDLKGKLPDVKMNKDIGVDGALSLGYDHTVGLGAQIKGVLDGSLQVALDIGLDIDNPFFILFNALPYASLLVDANGVIVRANAACSNKWGYPATDLEGKLYKLLLSGPSGSMGKKIGGKISANVGANVGGSIDVKLVEKRLAAIEALFKANPPSFEMDSVDVKLDGTQIEVEVIGTPIRIMGKLYAFIITGHVCFNSAGKRYKGN